MQGETAAFRLYAKVAFAFAHCGCGIGSLGVWCINISGKIVDVVVVSYV